MCMVVPLLNFKVNSYQKKNIHLLHSESQIKMINCSDFKIRSFIFMTKRIINNNSAYAQFGAKSNKISSNQTYTNE